MQDYNTCFVNRFTMLSHLMNELCALLPERFGKSAMLQFKPVELGKLIFITLCLFCLVNFLDVSSKKINNLVYFGCLLPALIWGVMNSSKTLNILKSLPTLFWMFLLVTSIFAFWGGSFGQAKATVYLLVFWLALVAMSLWRAKAGHQLFLFLAVCASFALVRATYLWFDHLIAYGEFLRIELWSHSNPNEVALMAVAAWVGFWEFYVQPRIKTSDLRSCFLGFALLCGVVGWAIIVFQSRSALLGFLLYFALKFLTDSRRWHLLAAFISMLVFFWAMELHSILFTRGGSYRAEIWADAWRHLIDVCGLVKGCGHDPYKIAGMFYHPHSAYLSMLYDNGLFAFMFFLAFLINTCVFGFKCQSKWLYVAAIGLGGVFTTTGGVVHSPEPYWIYFWIPILMITIECQLKDKNCLIRNNSSSYAGVAP